jgi:hypothetical protein
MFEQPTEVVEPESTESSVTQQAEEQAVVATDDSDVEGWEAIDPATPGPSARDHAKAVANARRKAQEETEARYSAFRDMDPGEASVAWQLYQYQRQDPVGYAHYIASQTPALREKLVAQTPAPQGDPELPKPVLDNYTGQYFYSQADLDKILSHKEQKLRQELEQTVTPLKQKIDQWDTEAQGRQRASQEIENYARDLPAFDDLLPAIVKEMEHDKRLTIPGAWRRVYERDHLPKLKTGERENTMDTLKKKAMANTEGRPSKLSEATTTKHHSSRAKQGFENILTDLERKAVR